MLRSAIFHSHEEPMALKVRFYGIWAATRNIVYNYECTVGNSLLIFLDIHFVFVNEAKTYISKTDK